MKKLDEISVKEIVSGMGIAIDSLGLDLVFGDNEEAKKELRELSKRDSSFEMTDPLGKVVRISSTSKKEEYVKIMNKYADSVNKENLIAYSLFNVKLYTERKNLSKEDRKSYESSMRKYIELLGKRDFNMVYLQEVEDESGKIKDVVRVINSQELIECVKKGRNSSTLFMPSKKKIEKLQKVDETLGLYALVHMLTFNDIKSIVTYGNEVAEYLNKLIHTNIWEVQKRKLQSNDDKMTEVDVEDIGKATADVLTANCKYINVDKLYLLISYRFIEMLEEDKDANPKIYYPVMLLLLNYIEKGTTVEIREREENLNDVYNKDGKIIKKYSLNDLTEDMKRFVGERFIRKTEIEETKKAIMAGEKTLRTADPEIMGFLQFTENDIETVVKASEDNIIFTLERGLMDYEALSYVLATRGECSDKLLSMMIEKGFVEGQDVLYLYYNGVVTLDNIRAILGIEDEKTNKEIKTVEPDFINKDDINEIIREIYKKVTNQENEEIEKDVEAFYKIIDLYKLLNVKGKKEEEISDASFSLIESFGDDLDSKVLEQLYQYGLIRLKDAAEWGVNLKKMLVQGDIRPTDLKALYGEGAIRIEDIKNALIGDVMQYEEKLDLIYSTFDGESEEEYEIRDELIQLLETDEEYKDGGHGKRTPIIPIDPDKEKKTRGREYVSDPHARWKFLSLLDKDYSKMFVTPDMKVSVSDGHRIFLLPNLDSVIIEKMLEKRGGRQVSSYAAATYILSRKTFTKFLPAIIEDGIVIRTTLGDLSRAKSSTGERGATRIIHNKTWGENIKKYFGIDEQNERYSKEEIAEINKAIELVEKSKQERE